MPASVVTASVVTASVVTAAAATDWRASHASFLLFPLTKYQLANCFDIVVSLRCAHLPQTHVGPSSRLRAGPPVCSELAKAVPRNPHAMVGNSTANLLSRSDPLLDRS